MGAKIKILDFLGVFGHGESESVVCLGVGVISALLRQTHKKPDFCHFLPFLAIFTKVWPSLSRKLGLLEGNCLEVASKNFPTPPQFFVLFRIKVVSARSDPSIPSYDPVFNYGSKNGWFFRDFTENSMLELGAVVVKLDPCPWDIFGLNFKSDLGWFGSGCQKLWPEMYPKKHFWLFWQIWPN